MIATAWGVEPTELHSTGDKTHDSVAHGEHAERLLNDELLLWVLGEMRRKAHTDWEDAPVADVARLQVLRLRIDVMKEFIAHLQSLIASGRVSASVLESDETRREFERRYGKIPQ